LDSESLVNLPSSSQSTTPHADPLTWKIIYEFAMTDLSLPNAEIRLQAHLGNRFIDADWQPALRAVMDAEGDSHAAVIAIKPLEQAAMRRLGLKIQISLRPKELPQLKLAEEELIESIKDLKARNRIFDTLPTLNEVLDPPEEVEIREIEVFSSGEKGEQEIETQYTTRWLWLEARSSRSTRTKRIAQTCALQGSRQWHCARNLQGRCQSMARVMISSNCRSSCVVFVDTYGDRSLPMRNRQPWMRT